LDFGFLFSVFLIKMKAVESIGEEGVDFGDRGEKRRRSGTKDSGFGLTTLTVIGRLVGNNSLPHSLTPSLPHSRLYSTITHSLTHSFTITQFVYGSEIHFDECHSV
jgi:hypothetical protein